MENVSVVKISDLTELFNQLSHLRSEIKQLKERKEEAKAYSTQQTDDMLHLLYCSLTKQVIEGKLSTKYLDGHTGGCIIILLAIQAYLKSKENSNQ